MSFLALAGLLAMYSIRFSKLSEAQYSRSVLPRHPRVLISLTGALVVLFSMRAAYETLAASSVWALPSFPPLRWSHAVFFLAFDLFPVLISLSLTARIPSQQATATKWEAEESSAAGWESPAAALKHSASALVRAQLLQPLTASSTGSHQQTASATNDEHAGASGTIGSAKSGRIEAGRRQLRAGGGSEQLDYGVFASLYGSQHAASPRDIRGLPQSAPGGTSSLLASLALPRVSSRESLRSVGSTDSAGDTRLLLPGSYQAPVPAALQRLQSPQQRAVARSVGDVSTMRLGGAGRSGSSSGRPPAFSGSTHFNHPARYDMPIDGSTLSMPSRSVNQPAAFTPPRSTLAPSQAASRLVQQLEKRSTTARSQQNEELALHLEHVSASGRWALYAEDSPSAANLLG